MPRYDFVCDNCGYYEELRGTYDTPREMDCPACNMEKAYRKQISQVAFIIKGSNAKNGYKSIPTNEQIGLPPERELMKRLDSEYWMENVQSGREVTQQEKEIIKDHKKKEADAKKPVQDKIKLFKEKYPEIAKKTADAFAKSKGKGTEAQAKRMQKKREQGDIGTRKMTPTEVMQTRVKK